MRRDHFIDLSGHATPLGLPERGPRLKGRAKFMPTLRVESTSSEI